MRHGQIADLVEESRVHAKLEHAATIQQVKCVIMQTMHCGPEITSRPTMSRRARVAALIVLAGALIATTTIVLVGRHRLEAWNDEIDQRWIPLRADFAIRYQKLEILNEVFRQHVDGPTRIDRDVARLLDRWERLLRSSVRDGVDEEAEAHTAAALERSARRLIVYVTQSADVRPDNELDQAILAFARSPLPRPELPRYNAAIVDYEATRDSVIGAPAAHLLAYYGRSSVFLTIV